LIGQFNNQLHHKSIELLTELTLCSSVRAQASDRHFCQRKETTDPTLNQNNMLHHTMPPHLKNKSSKILHICDCIQRIAWTPKKFLYAFLKNTHIAVATCRGYWGTRTGWTSTEQLLDSIQQLKNKTVAGKALWRAYILKEVLKGCRYISAMRVLPKPVPASTKVCSE
jgi:hypothetical protein